MTDAMIGAAILGLVEGLTEFLPVSSTGHLLLMNEILDFQGPPGKVFEIVVQLGAVLAVVFAYFQRLWKVAVTAPRSKDSQRFIFAVLLAFFPSVAVGAFAHDFIKNVLFNPWVVSVSFIVGGVLILLVEAFAPKPKIGAVEKMPLKTALTIGAFQCLAMVPGISRSGATIMGALLLKVERKTAAEFSFFLAIPTMVAATAYDIYKNAKALNGHDMILIALGFAVAFVSALFVVKMFVEFVGKHGFAPFAWYRIAAGTLALAILIAQSSRAG